MGSSAARLFPGEARFAVTFVVCAGGVAVAVCSATGHYFWLAACVAGVALLCYATNLLRRTRVAARWAAAEGVIVKAFVQEVRILSDLPLTEYVPVVHFEYPCASGTGRSERFSLSPDDFRTEHRSDACNLISGLGPGSSVRVHVCPDDPAWAVLRTDRSSRRRQHCIATFVAGAMVTAAALLLSVSSAP